MNRNLLAVRLVTLSIAVAVVSLGAFAAISKQVVTITIDELSLVYSKEITWDKEGFSEGCHSYLLNPESYLQELATKTSASWLSRGVEVTDWQISFSSTYTLETQEVTYNTRLQCNVHNAISKSGDRYTVRFQWLLTPLRLDFIDDKFMELTHGLLWEGELAGVPTVIAVEAPMRDCPYVAWHQPNGHCHAHLWWEKQP